MQQTNLHIAMPCHENWNAMTLTDAGRFCGSCSKQVVDFTAMTDSQILRFLSKQSGGLCGRFDASQLARPLVEPTLSKQKSWYLALMLPFSLLFQKSFGQKGEKLMGKPAVKVEQKPPVVNDMVMGGIMLPPLPEWVTLHGTLTGDKGDRVENASITVKGTSYTYITDSAGRFSIKLRRQKEPLVLTISALGYEPLEKKLSLETANEELSLILHATEAELDSVIVTSYGKTSCRHVSGAVGVVHIINSAEKRDSSMRKLLRMNPVAVYPNPAKSGSCAEIKFTKAGMYEVQLLSTTSALLKLEHAEIKSDGRTISFLLPSNLASGIYYLRFISSDKKRSYLEKILVN